jgi:hypothetical protein
MIKFFVIYFFFHCLFWQGRKGFDWLIECRTGKNWGFGVTLIFYLIVFVFILVVLWEWMFVAGFFFLAAKYRGRTCGWCICNQPPITSSPSVFCSQKKRTLVRCDCWKKLKRCVYIMLARFHGSVFVSWLLGSTREEEGVALMEDGSGCNMDPSFLLKYQQITTINSFLNCL